MMFVGKQSKNLRAPSSLKWGGGVIVRIFLSELDLGGRQIRTAKKKITTKKRRQRRKQNYELASRGFVRLAALPRPHTVKATKTW